MLKLITSIICQFIFIHICNSQDHVKELARDTWQDYIDVRNRMDSLDKLVKSFNNRTRILEKNDAKDFTQIDEYKKKLNAVSIKLRKAQAEYLKKSNDVKTAYQSIKSLAVKNSELNTLADSFSVALGREKYVREQLVIEKNLLEKSLYYKIADLEIAEVENSYFSKFSFGYQKSDNEIIYSVNSKDQSKKPIFRSLEYLRFNGNVYAPPGIDSLIGKILIYKDDILFDEVPQHFTVDIKTKSYNYFDLNGNNIKLIKKLPTKGNVKIAFVSDEIYYINQEKLKNFYNAYRSALFILTSIKPFINVSQENESAEPTKTNNTDAFAKTDTLSTSVQNLKILICNNADFSGEFVSLAINDSVLSSGFRLLTFNHSFSCNYRFRKPRNIIKIKVLSTGSNASETDCYLWLYISTIEDEKFIYKKKVVLRKGDLFALYINN